MPVPMFETFLWFEIDDPVLGPAGSRKIAGCALDRDCQDFCYLIGQRVEVNGRPYLCRGVERFAHCPPWRRGEPVGLWVEEIQ